MRDIDREWFTIMWFLEDCANRQPEHQFFKDKKRNWIHGYNSYAKRLHKIFNSFSMYADWELVFEKNRMPTKYREQKKYMSKTREWHDDYKFCDWEFEMFLANVYKTAKGGYGYELL